jgi:hypothetical protein
MHLGPKPGSVYKVKRAGVTRRTWHVPKLDNFENLQYCNINSGTTAGPIGLKFGM